MDDEREPDSFNSATTTPHSAGALKNRTVDERTTASPTGEARRVEQWWMLRAGSVRLSCTLRRDEDLPGVEARVDRNGELVAARLCLSRTAAIAWAESVRVRAVAAGYLPAQLAE